MKSYTSSSMLMRLFDRPIAFHRCLIPITGSLTSAVMLGQAVYWSPRTSDPEGWFYKTQTQWSDEIGLTRTEQENARKTLRSKGILEEKRVGVPSKLYFRVNFDVLETLTGLNAGDQHAGKPQSSTREDVNRRVKPANMNAGNDQSLTAKTTAESTTETTAETTVVPPAAPAEPTERPPKRIPETVWHQTIAAIKAAFEEANPGVKAPWGALAFVRLKVAMEGCEDWGVAEWQKCISNRFASDSINAGEPPVVFIPYLNRYLAGPLDQYKHPKEGSNGRYVPSARTARNRAAVEVVNAAIDRGDL